VASSVHLAEAALHDVHAMAAAVAAPAQMAAVMMRAADWRAAVCLRRFMVWAVVGD
jgi:hypothetical protein